MENSNWVELPIKDVAVKLTSGGTPSTKKSEYYENGDIPWLNTKEVDYNRITSTEKYITEEGLKNSSAKWIEENSVIVAMYGATAAKTAITKIPLTTNQACCNIIVNHEVCDYEFLFYNISNKYSELENIAVGAAQQNLSVGVIGNFILKFPPLPEQKAIASVLSSLDDKIDLLHQQNQTLEALAETLFRQWFIVDAKEYWEEVQLGDLVDVFNGVSYKSDDLNPSTTAMVTLKSFERNGGFRMDGFKEYTGKYKETHVVEEGDLVVAHTDITQDAALIGNPVLVKSHPNYDKLVISMDLVKVVSKNSNFTNEFLYLLMKTREFKEHALGYSNGSTVLHLSKKAIPEFELKLPPNELVHLFTEKVSHLIKKQFENQQQIQTLTQLRDTLLPKLMSGEVRVKL